MKQTVCFRNPWPGSEASVFIGDAEVTFELLDFDEEEYGSGRSEAWGVSVVESWIRRTVREARVVLYDGESYSSTKHPSESYLMDRVTFYLEGCML